MNALKRFFNRLAAFSKLARQQREFLLQQKRERFLAVHNSDIAPPEMLAPSPRRMPHDVVFLLIWSSALLLCGFHLFGSSIIPAFRSVERREYETREWVQRLTAKPPANEHDEQNQKLAKELVNLEITSSREMRSVMVLGAAFFATAFVVFPLLLIWLFVEDSLVLRNGKVTRAELVSRKRWASSARLSFTTADGRQVAIVRTIPSYVPIGTKLWVLYSQRSPKRVRLYNPNRNRTGLLRK
jgi:hypothetical protein